MNNLNSPVDYVPEHCNAWQDFYETDKFPYWWYRNLEGKKMFIVVRQPRPGAKRKACVQGSYDGIKKRYVKENLWAKIEDFKLPLLRLPELIKTELPILITEGEGKCDKAQQLLPDYFTACYSMGGSSFGKTDFSVLKGRDVILWPDADKNLNGTDSFESLSLVLKEEYGIEAKTVPTPTYQEIQSYFKGKFPKTSWDLGDEIPAQVNIRELLSKAEYKKINRKILNIEYSDIRKYKDDFIYISQGLCFWDRTKRRARKEKDVNNIFLRSKERGHYKTTASEWLLRHNIEIVEGTTFNPIDKEIVVDEATGEKNLNLYRKPNFKPLEVGEGPYDNKWFFNHVELLGSYDEEAVNILHKTIACAVQYPEVNRQWALMIYGGHGIGKGILFQVMAKLVGESNSSFLKLIQLVGRFQSFLMKHNNLFISEAHSTKGDDSDMQSTLKSLITDENFTVEQKGIDHIDLKGHFNVYMATNTSNPVRIEADDRRICYIETETPKSKVMSDDPDYYNKFLDCMKDKNLIRSLYDYYKNYKVDKKFLYELPITKWRDQLIKESTPAYRLLLSDLFNDKQLPCFHFDIINADELHGELSAYLLANPTAFAGAISKKMCETWIRKIKGVFKIRHYAIDPPNHKRGHYWIIRNFDEWRLNKESIEEINKHFSNEDRMKEAEKKINQPRDNIPF